MSGSSPRHRTMRVTRACGSKREQVQIPTVLEIRLTCALAFKLGDRGSNLIIVDHAFKFVSLNLILFIC